MVQHKHKLLPHSASTFLVNVILQFGLDIFLPKCLDTVPSLHHSEQFKFMSLSISVNSQLRQEYGPAKSYKANSELKLA